MNEKIDFNPIKATVDVNPEIIDENAINNTVDANIGLIRDLVRQGASIDDAINQVFYPVMNNATESQREGLKKAVFQIKNLLSQEKE